jgi:hypothetical protein
VNEWSRVKRKARIVEQAMVIKVAEYFFQIIASVLEV